MMKTKEEFYEKPMRTLELPQILRILQEEAVCASAKEEALKLRPSDIMTEVEERLRETSDAKRLISLKGTPPLSDIREVTGSLARARLGGMLNTRELLDIAGVLRAARQMKGWSSEEAGSLSGLFGALIANKFLEEKITLSIVGEEETSLGCDGYEVLVGEGCDTVEDGTQALCDLVLFGFALRHLVEQLCHSRLDGREFKDHRRVEPGIGMAGKRQDPHVLAPQYARPPLQCL